MHGAASPVEFWPQIIRSNFRFFSVFEDHAKALKAKALKRSTIRNKVSSTHWVLESRILDITSHALIESAVNYGPAACGTHITSRDINPAGFFADGQSGSPFGWNESHKEAQGIVKGESKYANDFRVNDRKASRYFDSPVHFIRIRSFAHFGAPFMS